MKQHLLEQSVIHADETALQVLRENGKPATSESQMWVYATGEHSRNQFGSLNTSLIGAANARKLSRMALQLPGNGRPYLSSKVSYCG